MVARGKDGVVREFGIDRNTLLYLKWITNNVLLCSTGNSAQCYVASWMGREFGGEWIHVYVCMAESLYCPSETITTLLICYETESVSRSIVSHSLRPLGLQPARLQFFSRQEDWSE